MSSEVDDPFGSSNSSFDHSVNKQNSSPTRQISPVRLHTQVGVPLKEINFSSSYDTKRRRSAVGNEEVQNHKGHMCDEVDLLSCTYQQ